MFRNHKGRENKTWYNPCADCLPLGFSTHTAYLFASEQWLSGYELGIQITSHPGSVLDSQPSTSGTERSGCQVISIILFLPCPW